MNGNIRVGNLFGIPFYINPSWFIVFGLVTFVYGSDLAQFPQLTGALPWLLGMVTALMLFASVLAHELGHSVVAMSQGIEVKSITLFIFGGLASLGEESKTPLQSFLVAIAGPVVSFALFGAFFIVSTFAGLSGPLAAVVALLAYINLALGAFNLIPGLPLDGGNVLKSIVWKITGKPYRGIAFASRVGQFFGWVGIVLGLDSVFGFSTLIGLQPIGSIWTLLIGWFLLQNAGRSAQSAAIQEQLSGLTAADAVYPNSPMVSADLSLRELANNHIIGSDMNWRKYLVVDDENKVIGEIEVNAMKNIPTNDWWTVNVRDVMQPAEQIKTVSSDKPLLDVIGMLEDEQLSALAVTKDNGVLVGLLEKASITELLRKRAEGDAPIETTAA
ncbi:MAG: site-2 protease family protein [Elainellaceae cyanobacterium]